MSSRLHVIQFDRDQAEAFLKVIDPEAAGFIFQTFDDSPRKRPELARVFHASIDVDVGTKAGVAGGPIDLPPVSPAPALVGS